MRQILIKEICNEKPNSAALGAFNEVANYITKEGAPYPKGQGKYLNSSKGMQGIANKFGERTAENFYNLKIGTFKESLSIRKKIKG